LNSTLDNVNELLRLGYGDTYRLENIKQRLANGKVLYASDNDYLQKVVSQYRGEIQKVGEHKKREPTPEPKHVPTPEPKSEPTTSKNKSVGNKKNIFIVVGGLAILAVIGGAVVMSGGFEKTVSTSVDDSAQPSKEVTSGITISDLDTNSKCGAGTIFDEATSTCLLEGTVTTSKCRAGTIFDEATSICLLEGTVTTSKCGAETIFDDATNTCLLEGTVTTSKCGAGTIFDEELNMCVLKVIPTHPKCGPGVLFDEENRKCIAP